MPGYHKIENGVKSGYGYDFLRVMGDCAGWKLELVGYDRSWADMLEMLERGEIDLVTWATRTPEREARFDYSARPIYTLPSMLTVRSDDSRFKPGDYAGWNGMRIGMQRGNRLIAQVAEYAGKRGFKYVPVYYDTVEEMFHALEQREVDALALDSISTPGDELALEMIDAQPVYVIVRKGNRELLAEVDAAMERMAADYPELNSELLARYYPDVPGGIFSYTDGEKEFIRSAAENNTEFKVLIHRDRFPYSGERDGAAEGILNEMVKIVADRSGLKFDVVVLGTADGYADAVRGDNVDVIMGIPGDYNLAEQLDCALTRVVLRAPISMVYRRDFNGTPDSIALLRDSAVSDLAIQRNLLPAGATPVYYDNIADLLDAVRDGRQEFGIVPSLCADDALSANYNEPLVSKLFIGTTVDLAVGVKKHNDPMLFSILEKTVRSIGRDAVTGMTIDRLRRDRPVPGLWDVALANMSVFLSAVAVLLLGGCVVLLRLLAARRRSWRYGMTVGQLPLEFLVFDRNGRLLMYNDGEKLFPSDRLKEARMLDDLPDADFAGIVRSSVAEVWKSGQTGRAEYLYRGRWRSSVVSPLNERIFGVPAVIWISQDTDELQRIKREAQLNAERFDLTLHSIGDGVLAVDAEGRITIMNAVAERLSGWKFADAVGRPHETVCSLVSYRDDTPVESPVRKALESGRSVHLSNHTDIVSKSGMRRHIADSASPIRDASGRLIGAIMVFRDVTEEYRKRDALRAVNAIVEYGSELTGSAAFRVSAATGECIGSVSLDKLWPVRGGRLAEPESWMFAEDVAGVVEARRRVLSGELKLADVAFRADRNGELHYYRCQMTLDDSDLRNKQILGVIQDVTESEQTHREMERLNGELKDALAMFRQLIDNLPCYVVAKDIDDGLRYTMCNRLFLEMTGLSDERIIGHFECEFFPNPHEVELFRGGDMVAVEKNMSTEQVIPFTGCDGMLHQGHAYRFPLKLSDGRHWLFMLVDDITGIENERRGAERLAERFRLTLNSIGDGVIVTDEHGVVTLMNPVAERMTGVKSADGVGKPHEKVFRIVSALNDEPMSSPVTRTLRTGNVVELANHTDLLGFNGRRFHIADSAAPIHNDAGAISGAILVFRDVTEEYLQRDNLRSAVSQMELGAEMTLAATFRVDPATREISGSKLLGELWPVKDGIAMPMEEWVHPEDLPTMLSERSRFFFGGGDIRSCTFRAVKNGETRYYRMSASPDRSDPKRLRLFGVVQDITDIARQSGKLREARDLWNIVLDLIPVMIFAKRADDEFRYTLANRAFELFCGKAKNEIIGITDAQLFNRPEDLKQFKERDSAIMVGGKAETFSEEVVGADGLPHVFRTTKMPFTDADGRPLLLAVSFDVTELNSLIANLNVVNSCLESVFNAADSGKAIEQVLEAVCRHMRAQHSYIFRFAAAGDGTESVDTVAEYAGDGFEPILRGMHGFVIPDNTQAVCMLRRHETVILNDLTRPEQQEVIKPWVPLCKANNLRACFIAGIFVNGEFWGDFGLVYRDTAAVPFCEHDLKFLHAAAHMIELLLERDRISNALKAALAQAKSAERDKSMFLATMSHEIRTPLNAVIGFSELLQDETLAPAERNGYLASVFAAGNALLALINDVLDLSKLDAGQMKFASDEVSFKDMADEMSAIFRLKLAEKHLKLKLDIQPDMPTVFIDRLRLRQILFNLIGNAVKFTDVGGITVSAGFEKQTGHTGRLFFRVADTGIGIGAEERKRLFQLFYQIDTAKPGGTGLGLALVRKLLEHMNGTIELKSEVGQGTEFLVEISGISYGAAASGVSTSGAGRAETAVLPLDSFPDGVLLVDDVPLNLEVMTAMLRKLGMPVDAAADADAALKKLRLRRYSLLMTDLWMPGVNGDELALRVRSGDTGNKDMRIVAVTADVAGVASLDMSRFDAVLTKPVTMEKLRSMFLELGAGK